MMDPEQFLKSAVNYLDILRDLDEGVAITDIQGNIMFLNDAQARIDGIDPAGAIGRPLEELWEVTEENSLILKCLSTGQPIVNKYLAYRSRAGRIANTINSVFPLRTAAGLVGSISFVRAYNLMEETITSICTMVENTRSHSNRNGTRFTFQDIIGESPAFLDSLRTAKMAALTPSQVMIHGDTGTGKELFAQSIHNYSSRKTQIYMGLNCAAIPENLLEGLLFGTTRGAFTGATDKPGLFEKASGGTLYLDEVNSMTLGLQAKLLRVLQENRVRRVGSLEEREISVKVLSSVNEDPHLAIESQRLRLDLFYRLAVVLLHIPPLKERRSDIPLFIRSFIDKYNQEFGRHVEGVSAEVEDLFEAYPWPGNVRELEHVIEGAMNVVGERTIIGPTHLPSYVVQAVGAIRAAFAPAAGSAGQVAPPIQQGDPDPGTSPPGPGAVLDRAPRLDPRHLRTIQAESEQRTLAQALAETAGNLSGAARILGISRQRLTYRMAKYGLERRDFLAGPAVVASNHPRRS